MATKSQHFAIPSMEAAPVERVCKVSNQEEVNDLEMYGFAEYTVSSGEVSSSNAYMEELSDMSYQRMMQQEYELALPIDDSGNSWTLKGISGHTMGLEGICWNVPVRIGGIEFSHNFFITRMDLGNKDMVLGQPWLFSHSTRMLKS